MKRKSKAVLHNRKQAYERRPFNSEDVRPRKTAFEFPPGIARHWVDQSPFNTAIANSLNLFLPPFESMIVRLTRDDIVPRLSTERLKKQARGFFGQEAIHGKTHERYLQNMEKLQGYRLTGYRRLADWVFARLLHKRLGPIVSLSAVSAFEHYTDILVLLMLNTDFLDKADPIMREFFYWHSAEELEHNAVAFEMLQDINSSYWLRMLGNVLGLGIILGFVLGGATYLLAQDKQLFARRTWREAYQFFFSKYRVAGMIVKLFFHYSRPAYHPDDADYSQLARKVLDPRSMAA